MVGENIIYIRGSIPEDESKSQSRKIGAIPLKVWFKLRPSVTGLISF